MYEDFVERLAARVKTLKVGNGLDADVDQGPLISSDAVEVERHIDDATKRGARVTGGQRHALGRSFSNRPCSLTLRSTWLVAREEPLDVSAPLSRFEDEGDVIRQPFSLRIFTRATLAACFTDAEALEYGHGRRQYRRHLDRRGRPVRRR